MKMLVLSITLCTTLLIGCAAMVTKSSPDAEPLRVSAESGKNIVLHVTGSKIATESKDWSGFKSIWYDAMKDEVAAAGRRLTIQDSDTKTATEPGTLVIVYINNYHWVSAVARFSFGVMTGDAFVDSKISFVDLQSGRQIGERSYNTTSSGGQGIFSAMTDKQVAVICKEIVSEIQLR